MPFTTRRKAISGLIFSFVFPTIMIRLTKYELTDLHHLVIFELIWCVAVAALLLFVLFAEGRPLSSVGYRALHLSDVGISIAAAFVLFAGLALISFVILPALNLDMTQETKKLWALPFSWRLTLVARGVVTQELFYRGYAIERLQELTSSRMVAGICSGAVFTLAATSGWAQFLFAGFAAVILTLLYLWRRNVLANMITHALVDIVGVLAA